MRVHEYQIELVCRLFKFSLTKYRDHQAINNQNNFECRVST